MALHDKWRSPTVNDATNSTMPPSQRRRRSLIADVMMFPTPTTPRPHDSEGTAGKFMPGQKQKDLTWAVHNYPTPQASSWGSTGSRSQPQKLVDEGTITADEKRKMQAGNGGQLNPNWVEWLMGWPIGWTDLEPLETDKFQQWLQLHGAG